ncbi:MAG: hypothetical protein HKN37_13800 [Rhodothermales bacterium]|nr:hypothetical protein [Rhodothermales bacterium]
MSRMTSKNLIQLTVALVAVLTIGTPIHAHGGGGHGFQGGMGMFFDPTTVTTLSGSLGGAFGDWQVRGHGNHTGGGMGFDFEADDGSFYNVMLAPDWFLEESGVSLEDGVRVTLTGSVVETYDNGRNGHGGQGGHGGHGGMGGHNDAEAYVIVTVLSVNGVTVQLRDDDGYPLWRGGPGWDGHRWFDPDAITNVNGTLREELGMWSSWGHGNHTGNSMHHLLESDSGETFYAMLGPSWFLEGQGIRLTTGQKVKIKGSIVDSYWSGYDDHRYVVATEITVGGKTAQLRDEWGYPLWHGTGWHYYSPDWNQGTRTRIQGTVRKVRRRTHGQFLDKGYELLVEADGVRHIVFVAPNWDVKHLGLKIRKGQEIKVAGSFINSQSRPEMVARYLVAEGKRWRFRTKTGSPLWVVGAK